MADLENSRLKRPWEREPRYRFLLAAFASALAMRAGEMIARWGSPVRMTGTVMEPAQIEEAMLLLGAGSPAQVEDQIRIIANVVGDYEVAERLGGVMGRTFNLIERGRRPIPAGASDCIWWVGILPPFTGPADWPKDYPAKADWPNTFTLEIVAWPAGTDLGKLATGI